MRGGVNNTQLLSQCRHTIYNSIYLSSPFISYSIAFAALKTNATEINQETDRNANHKPWHSLTFLKIVFFCLLQRDYEILNSPRSNKKPSLTIELVQNIVYTQRCLEKHQRDTGRKEGTIMEGKKTKRNLQVTFTHDHREQPAKIINVRQLSTASQEKKTHLSKYLQHKSFPFIYQALTKPYCTLSRPTPSDPPTHICDSLTLQFTTCRDGRGRDSI